MDVGLATRSTDNAICVAMSCERTFQYASNFSVMSECSPGNKPRGDKKGSPKGGQKRVTKEGTKKGDQRGKRGAECKICNDFFQLCRSDECRSDSPRQHHKCNLRLPRERKIMKNGIL